MSFLNGDALLGEDFVELRAALRIVPIDLSASCYPKRPADTDSALAHGFQTQISMNSLFQQGEIVACSPNGDDKRNPNAKGQSSNKVQMSKFKGHTAGLGARG
jgi:hypothetical protein